jgi:hypothetical protein
MEHEKDERPLGLSAAQVAGSALAAVSGAILASTAGVTGTVIGAAVASVVATVGAAIYTWSLRRTTVAVRKTAAQVRQAALVSGPLPRTVVQGPLRTIKGRAAAKSSKQDGSDREDPEAVDKSAEDPDEDTWWRSIPWGKVLIASLAITVVALAGITVVEALTGKPISNVTGGGDSQGTTVGNVTGRDNSPQDKGPAENDKTTPGDEQQENEEPNPDQDTGEQDPGQQDGEQEDPEPSDPVQPEPSDVQSVVPEGAPAP